MTSTAVSPSRARLSRHHTLGLLGAIGVGAALAVQSRVNGVLAGRLGDPVATGVVSFGLGFVVLFACAVAARSARRGAREVVAEIRTRRGIRPWHCIGGLSGAYLVFSQGVSAGVLGVALFTVSVVAGQVVSGLVVDWRGLGPGGPQRITAPRLLGAALAVVSVVVAVSANLGAAHVSWLMLLPMISGVGTAWQQAVNGRVKQVADSALTVSTLNFGIGVTALLVAWLVELALRGLPRHLPPEMWLYSGGLLGIGVIAGSAVIVRHTGVLVLAMGTVAGQLLTAGLLDTFAPTPGTHLAPSTVVGIALTLVSVGIASWPSRRPPATPRPREERRLPR